MVRLSAPSPEPDRAVTSPLPCPCGSDRAYADCCGPVIAGVTVAQTAEQLMRSRYSAYTQGNVDWLRASWHPATRRAHLDLDPEVRWMGLRILSTQAGTAQDDRGTVEFVARYKIDGRAYRLHERSRFQRRDGLWYYVDGDPDP